MFTKTVVHQPNGGLDPAPCECDVRVRGGNKTRGMLLALDIPNADSDVDNLSYGSETSGLANVVTPTTADQNYGTLVVLKEDISDNQRGVAVYRGRVRALVQKGTGNISKGDPLYVSTSEYLDADATASGTKIVARAAEDVTGPATATLAWVILEGVYPLGTVA